MKTRRYFITAAIGALSLAWFADSSTPEGRASPPKASKLEVHEWGTFTSMQGTDGHSLEGMHHEEEALPAFVHRVVDTPIRERLETKGGVTAIRVTEKMETPVIYFYADKPTNVQVGVSYSGGLMSEWYPAAQHTVRGSDAVGDAVFDLARIENSSLYWNVDVAPRGKRRAGVPAVAADDPWAFARETQASLVTDKTSGESEHYLFYRGLGKSTLPISVEQRAGGALMIANRTGHRIPAAFVLEVTPNGARFVIAGKVSRKKKISMAPHVFGPTDKIAKALKAEVIEALVATGLFRDEARAMVKTWSRSWFESEGSRLIYIVPRRVVDEMLPLSITPKPDVTVRTLVGRLEYVKPEVAREVAVAVRHRTSALAAEREASSVRLARLGRYVEPHVRLLLATETDAAFIRNAGQLLEELCPKTGRIKANPR